MKFSNRFFIIQSILSVLLGIVLLINVQTTIIGAVIGPREIENYLSIMFGVFFVIAGIALYVVNKSKK
ncbi:MAG: hypothetical protein WC781_01225 [Candidatus Pacearchaeota archaeon]|jgi:ABC-type thiamin/hydroxymethylpyrimidine transport system permease subunit